MVLWLLGWTFLNIIQPEAKDYPDASVIYTLDSMGVMVNNDFSQETYHHIVMRIFTVRGRNIYSNFMQRYDKKNDKIEILLPQTHTIKQNGDTIGISKTEGIGDLSTVSSFMAPVYSNARLKTCIFGGVETGDFIKYTAVKFTTPTEQKVLFGNVVFASDEPISHKVFVLKLPDKLKLNYKLVGEIKIDSVYEKGELTYKFYRDSIARMEHEKYMFPMAAFGPRLIYTSFNSWNKLAGWLRGNFEKSIEIDHKIQEKAKDLGDIGRICQFVATGWRDIPVGFEDIGFTPTITGKIYKNKYGSPLDKVALLIAMIRSIGIEAYPSYIARYGIEKDMPAPIYFDDIVVAVPIGEEYLFFDPVFPDKQFFPIIISHILGKSEITYPLPFNRVSGTCFIVKKDTAIFYQIPNQASKSEVLAELTLSMDGTLSGKIMGTLNGIDAAYARKKLHGKTDKEIKQAFEGYASSIGIGTKLVSWKISNLDSILAPVDLELEFKISNYLTEQTQETRFNLPSNIFRFAPIASYFGCEKRKYPFSTLSPHITEFKVRVKIPNGFNVSYIPENFEMENDLVIARCEFEHEAENISYNYVWGFKKGAYESEDYNKLEQAYMGFVAPKNKFVLFKRR
ncbi:MAG: DUF3857 domain-containing protein [Candidatus Stahlbacteria bacterium]|nr:DUF3857 domain-containing protein [Candidatus Stahlbacteria bacterium]